MKYIYLNKEEMESIAYYKSITHISGEVSIHLIHDVLLSYLVSDCILVNYNEKRKDKYKYNIYSNNEANEEYLKYEFDLIKVSNEEKEVLLDYLCNNKVLKRNGR